MRSLAVYAACVLLGCSAAAAQGKGPAKPPQSGECLCIIPAGLPAQAVSAPEGSGQPGAGNSEGDRVVLGRHGRIVVLPAPACRALRNKFRCRHFDDPVSP